MCFLYSLVKLDMPSSQAIHSADVFSRRGKFSHLPCKLNVKQSVETVQLWAKIKNTRTTTTTAFATPNENDEGERSGSHACSGEQVFVPLENNYSSNDLDEEAAGSLPESGSGVFQMVEHSVNLASLLDKLKALHLHVLASEQWNASRLKLCHKYVGKLKLYLLCLPSVVLPVPS